jgi:hypothetical protein
VANPALDSLVSDALRARLQAAADSIIAGSLRVADRAAAGVGDPGR